MGLKEEAAAVKNELTQDEKMLAGMIRVERFYKRNKVKLTAAVAVLAAAVIFYLVMDQVRQHRLEGANTAYLKLQANPEDAEALQKLRSNNPKLAELFALKKALRSGDLKAVAAMEASDDALVRDLARYNAAAADAKTSLLKEYRMGSEALLKDMAIFLEAYTLMKAGDIKTANERLALIPQDSDVYGIATMLKHYGIAGGTQ